VADDASVAYLRPETAQGMFVNFENVLTTMRRKLPFGIAQIGRSFRNEITPGNFIFRDREFEQMEMEFFVMPGTDEEWHDKWIEARMRWWTDVLGVRPENLQLREHAKEELSHYSKRTADIEYNFPFGGFSEIEGMANRTDFGYGHRPLLPDGADRLVRRRGREGRKAHRPAPETADCTDQGRDPAALTQREAGAARAQGMGAPAPALHDAVRRRPEHRPPLPPPG
jgi:hypothetical protein